MKPQAVCNVRLCGFTLLSGVPKEMSGGLSSRYMKLIGLGSQNLQILRIILFFLKIRRLLSLNAKVFKPFVYKLFSQKSMSWFCQSVQVPKSEMKTVVDEVFFKFLVNSFVL